MRTDVPPEFTRPGLFPTPEQKLVLLASLADDKTALLAYESWRATLRIEDPFDHEVFRLLPLMYERLRELGVNDSLTPRLKGTYRKAWVCNHQLMASMRPVLAAMTAAGLRVMLIKGAPLAQEYYGNIALRPMEDIDVCVPRSQLEQALRVLDAIGYRPSRPVDDHAARFCHAVPMVCGQETPFDLHWDISYDCPGAAGDSFWGRTEPIRFLDQDLVAQQPTMLMLHTVVHGVRWNEEPPVRWIADAAKVLRRRGAEIDWSLMARLAIELRLNYRLALGLRYLREEMGQAVPAEVVRQLEAAPVDWLQRLERDTVLDNQRAVYERLTGPMRLALASFGRRAGRLAPTRVLIDFIDYLRVAWNRNSRVAVFAFMGYGLYSRFMRRPWRALRLRVAGGS